MGLKHAFKSDKPDPADSTIIGATKWNDDHYFLDADENPIGAVGDLPYRGVDGLVTLLSGAQGILTSAGSGNVPAWSMTPTITSITFGATSITETIVGKIAGITNGTAAASKALVVDANIDITGLRNLSMTGNLVATGVGPHAIGTTTSATIQVHQGGSLPVSAGTSMGFQLSTTINGPTGGWDLYGMNLVPTFVEASANTHPLIATLRVGVATVTAGAGSVTDTASIYVAGPMTATVGGANYAVWVDAGVSRFDAGIITNYVQFGSTGNNLGAVQASADGKFTLLDSTGISFSMLQYGGTTSSFPAFKRGGAGLQARLADDSDYADFIGRQVWGATSIRIGSVGSFIKESADGILKLSNAADNAFSRLQLGGTTSSFPALGRSGTELHAVLADNSDFTGFRARAVAVGVAMPSAGNIQASGSVIAATGSFSAGAITLDTSGIDFSTLGIYGTERAAPSAPAANRGIIYFQDNGAGKTQLMVIFSSGAAQQIAIQP